LRWTAIEGRLAWQPGECIALRIACGWESASHSYYHHYHHYTTTTTTTTPYTTTTTTTTSTTSMVIESESGNVSRKKWRQRKVAAAKRASEHRSFCHPKGGIGCLTCFRKARGAGIVRFLRGRCQPKGWSFGLGHKLGRHRGVVFCHKCGGWATKSVDKLARTCLGVPTAHGRRALSALKQGKKPQGLASWQF